MVAGGSGAHAGDNILTCWCVVAEYPLEYQQSFHNAYEAVTPGCSRDGVYCLYRNQTIHLNFNATTFGVYRILKPVLLMNVEVEVRRASVDQGAFAVLNIASRPQQSLPGAIMALTWANLPHLVSSDGYFAVVDAAAELAEGMALQV